MSEAEVSPAAVQQLKIISFAMGGGLTMMAGLVLVSYFNAEAKIPTVEAVRLINTLTFVAMGAALAAIIVSEVAWRSLRSKSLHPAFIVRLALREGGALLGMTVAYIAALNGVLRAYPAYWVDLAPFALFLGFLATHWPSAKTLTAEARGVVP